MTDYYSILRKALAELDRPGEDERYELYERARRTVMSRLRAADPPWPESDIDAQVDALGAAAARLERELEEERARPAPAQSASPAYEQPSEYASQAPGARADIPSGRGPWVAIAAALAAIVLAGLGATYIVSRDRAPPQPSARVAEPARPSPASTSAADPAQAAYVLRQQRVYYRTTHPPGTVIISRDQKFLYLVQPNQVAVRYAIGIGPECVNVAGLFQITGKVDQPKGEAEVRFGPRALYFGNKHAVHGTTEPGRVGQSASFGCFHQWNEDIVGLYDRVPLNERVVVAN